MKISKKNVFFSLFYPSCEFQKNVKNGHFGRGWGPGRGCKMSPLGLSHFATYLDFLNQIMIMLPIFVDIRLLNMPLHSSVVLMASREQMSYSVWS